MNLFACRKIHQVSSYFINSEVAHTCVIMRGDRCSSKGLKNGFVHNENEHSVLRVFLWPRVAVTGKYNLLKKEFTIHDFFFYLFTFFPFFLRYIEIAPELSIVHLPYHIISYHIISYHIISYHIISYHIISYHIIPYHTIPYHTIPYHIISYHIISYHIISYHISYHIISYHIFLLLFCFFCCCCCCNMI